jgi:hypothetical protein
MSIVFLNAWHLLEPGGVDGVPVDGFRYGGPMMNQREDGRLREGLAKDFEDALSPAHAGEPVMAQDHSQLGPRVWKS